MKTRIMFGTMVAMATLTIGLLGASVANAAKGCDAVCATSKREGMKSCRAENPCAKKLTFCKKACQEIAPGLERTACVDECKKDKEECQDTGKICGYDCGISFYECKKVCVEQGSH